MHEAGIAKDIVTHIIEHIKKETAPGRIKKISLTVGELLSKDAESLKWALERAMSEISSEVFSDTEIEIRKEKAMARCLQCLSEDDFEVTEFPICPKCGSISVQIKAGNQISINGIELH